MLTLLNISNIALIDELRVEFEPGLNLLTGETGSGKSIIVDALGLLIRRELAANGRNKIFINHQLATQALLRDLRPFLVDIHGQGDQQTLFDPDTHLELLDAFAGATGVAALRREVADSYHRW